MCRDWNSHVPHPFFFFLLKIEIPQCSSKLPRYALYFHLSSLYLICDETRCPVFHIRKHEKECFIYWVTEELFRYCPTDAKMFRYGMERSFLFFFFLSSQMIINSLKEIHIKCLVEDTISEWWFFFGNKKTTFMLSVVKEWLWKPVISIRTQAV